MSRVEAHPHRPKVLAGEVNTISTRVCKPGERVTYYGYLALMDVEFVVQPAGLERAKDEQVRNVHAFARGETIVAVKDAGYPVADTESFMALAGWVKVTYNPFKRDHFFEVTVVDGTMVPGRKVTAAQYAILERGNCWVLNPTFESQED